MIKAPISLQDLRRKIYVKAKSEPTWRFWGLYVHICKTETLMAAYQLAKHNNGAPGVDGVTFSAIEEAGLDGFIEQIQNELIQRTYRPLSARKVEIPKDNGRTRSLSIPAIRGRVVQGAVKLILEPIFEADFQPGSYGYRPKRSAQDAIWQVQEAIMRRNTHIIELDLKAYFDTIPHGILLTKIAQRVQDDDVMHLLKVIIKASGKHGVPQGGIISPMLSNIFLNELDKMLERAKRVTREGQFPRIEYVRFADDVRVLVSAYPRHQRLREKVQRRILEEIEKLGLKLNEDKSKIVDFHEGQSFSFLGFQFHYVRNESGEVWPLRVPLLKKRTALLRKLKEIFRRHRSQPLSVLISKINPIIQGWVNYFRTGNSSKCFSFVKLWVEKKIRRHLARACKRRGFGWKRWSSKWLYEKLGLYNNYRVTIYVPSAKVALAR